MSDVTILSTEIQPWPYTTTGTARVQFKLTQGGIDGSGDPHVKGATYSVTADVEPGDSPGVYKLVVPAIVIVATDDWQVGLARYNVSFKIPGQSDKTWTEFQNLVVPKVFPTFPDPTQGTYADLLIFNRGYRIITNPAETYTKQEINALIAAVAVPSSGTGNKFFGTPDGMSGAPSLRTLVVNDIPALPASLITTGVFNIARIPSLAALYAPTVHVHVAADISNFGTAVDARITNAAVLAAIGFSPANAVHTHITADITGFSAAVDARITAGAITTALTYTPENAANKNAASGYAGLTAGKLALAQMQEVMAVADLSDFAGAGAAGQLVGFQASTYKPLGGLPTTTNDVKILTGTFFFDQPATTNLNTTLANYYSNKQVEPIRMAFATRGSYNVAYGDGGGTSVNKGNVFHMAAYTTTQNTRPVVTLFAQSLANPVALADVLGAAGWATNFIGYTEVTDSSAATAHGMELDFGTFGGGANAYAYGLVIAVVGDGTSVAGKNIAFIHLQNATGASTARANHGIVCQPNSINQTTGAILKFPGITAGYVMDATLGTYTYGIDFASSTFSQAAIRMPGRLIAAGIGKVPGMTFQDAENFGAISGMSHYYNGAGGGNDDNQLWVGDNTTPFAGCGWDSIHFHVERNAAGTSTQGLERAVINRYGIGGVHLLGYNGGASAPGLGTGTFTGGGTGSPSITGTSCVGRDPGFKIAFTTTAAPAADQKIAGVTFVEAFQNAPAVIIQPSGTNGGRAEARLVHAENITASGFDLVAGNTALNASATYAFEIHTIGY